MMFNTFAVLFFNILLCFFGSHWFGGYLVLSVNVEVVDHFYLLSDEVFM